MDNTENKTIFLIIGSVLIGFALIILCIASAVVYMTFYVNKQVQEINNLPVPENIFPTTSITPTPEAQTESQKIAQKVSETIDAPDEKPNVVQIVDIDRLKAQNPEFYKDAKNNDYLLVYPKARKAIIYRMDENKIINFSNFEALLP